MKKTILALMFLLVGSATYAQTITYEVNSGNILRKATEILTSENIQARKLALQEQKTRMQQIIIEIDNEIAEIDKL